jgi:hypothetical protein
MASKFESGPLACLLTVLALGAASSSAVAQSREFQRGYEAGFRDGVASIQGGAGRPAGPGRPGWQSGRLVVLDAAFGLRGGPTCDARGTVQNIVDGRGANEVFASTRLCGDPAPNRPKQLMVTYRCDNRPPVRVVANEGQWLRLPC